MIKVLVACEESQTVTKAFRKRGFEAFSCDIQDCSGGHPEWHIKGDAIKEAYSGKYDLMIAHPPCTHLAVSGARWFKEGVKPMYLQDEGAEFFMKLINAPIEKIAVENPICIMSTRYRKPNQIINPFQFGHPEQKKTCLWLKGLPKLIDTNNVYSHMMTLPIKERTRIHWLGSNKSKERSKTYLGIANAMAEQWGDYIIKNMGIIIKSNNKQTELFV
jgi:hypothetical protein